MDYSQRQDVWHSKQERVDLGYILLARLVLFSLWEGIYSSLEREGLQKSPWPEHTVSQLSGDCSYRFLRVAMYLGWGIKEGNGTYLLLEKPLEDPCLSSFSSEISK